MKEVLVSFISRKFKNEYFSLKNGKYEDKQLYTDISKEINNLKNNHLCGTKIPKNLWPKIYIKKYSITNLWKLDLPNAYRLVYTIESDETNIVCIILECFDHKNYDNRFNY